MACEPMDGSRIGEAWKLFRTFVIKDSRYAQLNELLQREVLKAMALCRGDEVRIDIEDARRDHVFDGGSGKLLSNGASILRRDALHPEREQLLRREIAESGLLHAGSKLRRHVEDAIRDSILNRIHFKALLLELGDRLGRYALDLARNEIVGGKLPEPELAHGARVLGRHVLDLHRNHFVEVDVITGGAHAVDVSAVRRGIARLGRRLRGIGGLRLRLWLGLRCLECRVRPGRRDGCYGSEPGRCSNSLRHGGCRRSRMRRAQARDHLRRGDEEHGNSRKGRCEREGPLRSGRKREWFSEDARDSHAKCLPRLVAVERHGKVQLARALLFKMKQRAGIDDRVGVDVESEIVAAEFALVAYAGTYPPHGRMVEKEGFNEGLKQVAEKVGAANVRQLVRKNDFNLVWAEPAQGG